MKQLSNMASCVVLCAAMCLGQGSSSPATAAPNTLGHGAFPVKVTKALDSSKLKDGDIVEFATAGAFKLADGTMVPKGSKLVGHVASAKARSRGDQDSELSVTFEKLDISGGKQLSLKGMVQAVFPPAEEPAGPDMSSAGTSRGGSGGGANPAGIGITDSKAGSNLESAGGQAVMDPKASGVHGIHDLSLENGVLNSKGKSVKLGSGVRVIVRADILG